MKKMNNTQKEALVMALLPLLNQMDQSEAQSETVRFLAEKKQEITFADLMALSYAELEGLQKLVNSTRSAKNTQKNAKIYDGNMQRNYTISDNIESIEKKNKIIC